MLFNVNASSGGLDIVGKIISKYTHLEIGKALTVCGMITYGLCNLLNDISIIGFFIKMLICVIVPNILLILFYHKNEQFQEAKIFIFKILRRRKE